MNATEVAELDPPPPPKDIHESMAAYMELLNLGDAFIRSSLRRRVGPQGDLEAAYREWNHKHIQRAADEKVRAMREALAEGADNVR